MASWVPNVLLMTVSAYLVMSENSGDIITIVLKHLHLACHSSFAISHGIECFLFLELCSIVVLFYKNSDS